MAPEWHRMSVLRPCSAALRGGAPRAIFRQAQQRCGNSLRMARISVLRHFSAALLVEGGPRAIFRQAQQRPSEWHRMSVLRPFSAALPGGLSSEPPDAGRCLGLGGMRVAYAIIWIASFYKEANPK